MTDPIYDMTQRRWRIEVAPKARWRPSWQEHPTTWANGQPKPLVTEEDARIEFRNLSMGAPLGWRRKRLLDPDGNVVDETLH
ncbi:hypothetical protein [Nocardioides sp. HB32]